MSQIWGQVHLRASDLTRIIVPWAAFGDLEKAKALVPKHECRLIAEEEAERDRRMRDIDEAYAPILEPLLNLKQEFEQLAISTYSSWKENPQANHAFFGHLTTMEDNMKLRRATGEAKKAYSARVKELKANIKVLEKVQAERDEREAEIKDQFDREIRHIRESASDLMRICSSPQEAIRYFAIADLNEIADNEFNLNLPRYVDTFEPEEEIPIRNAVADLAAGSQAACEAQQRLLELMRSGGIQA